MPWRHSPFRNTTSTRIMDPARARAWRQLAVSYLAINALIFALSRATAQSYGLHDLIGALFLLAGLW
jgi:hypothetical protein